MNFYEYIQLALKTKAPAASPLEDLQHAGSGLFTEVGELIDQFKRERFYKKELDLVHLKEELGDVYWYFAVAAKVVDVCDYTDWTPVMLPHYTVTAAKLGALVSNVNVLAYTRNEEAFDYFIEDYLQEIWYRLQDLCSAFGFNREEIWLMNIDKLKARYGSVFTEEAAINRDLQNERKVMEC